MPNWTHNIITFTNKEVAKKYYDEDEQVDFNKIIPQPETKEDCPKEYVMGADGYIEQKEDKPWFNWYEWNIANWGTKWNACDGFVDESEVHISISFDTAWSAPIPIFKKICEDNPNEFIEFYCEYEDAEVDEDGGPIPVVYQNNNGVLEEDD